MIKLSPPYVRGAAAILAVGALTGVGTAKLDLAGLSDNSPSPPDRKPSFKPNADTREMPLPAFGGISPDGGDSDTTRFAHKESASNEFHVEYAAPKSDRSSLLASSSNRAIVSTSGVSRHLPDLVESKSDDAAFIAEKQHAPLPSPVFGQSFESPEEAGFAGSDSSHLADAQGSISAQPTPIDSFATKSTSSGTNGNYQAETAKLAQARSAGNSSTFAPTANTSGSQANFFDAPGVSRTERLVPAGTSTSLVQSDHDRAAVAAANRASAQSLITTHQQAKSGTAFTTSSGGQSNQVVPQAANPESESNTGIASFAAPELQIGQSAVQNASASTSTTNHATSPLASFAPQTTKSSSTGFIQPQNIQYDIASNTNRTQSAGLSDQPSRSYFGNGGKSPLFSEDDELIIELSVEGSPGSDTVIVYSTPEGIYLPFGMLTRILDIAVPISDGGHFAEGWTLDEKRTLTLDLRNSKVTLEGKEHPLRADAATAFNGELYANTGLIEQILPLKLDVNLRQQTITIKTNEPFPFEERLTRENNRSRLALYQANSNDIKFPREDTPYNVATIPIADVEARAISDTALGERVEGNIRLAGDLAFLTTEAFLTANTKYGLTNALLKFGRTDPDAELLGPLNATRFSFGDVSTDSLPVGVRGAAGRGLTLTNTPIESASVFENIDLRGVLPIGYEVELYRNDILIGSTAESNNGQYEFLQVPVDFGLNTFRIVFFGPQGQRREEVRSINVGDGRLRPGQFVYRVGAVQKDQNLLGVRDPFFFRSSDFGDWRVNSELSYGVSSNITAVAAGSWFETPEEDRWLVSGGVRTAVGQVALKSDIAFSDNNGFAIGTGLGSRIGGSSFRLNHFEYSGDFIDESNSSSNQSLRRASQLDFNSSVNLGDPQNGGVSIPITARLRHRETTDGGTQTNAALRATTRLSDVLVSNSLEFQRFEFAGLEANSRLFGDFDLTNLSSRRLRTRATTRYEIHPDPDLISMSFEVDYTIDEQTQARAQFGYTFENDSAIVGGSIVREFDHFSLALDGNYRFIDNNYTVGLRAATSFGHDPKRNNIFITKPNASFQGAASLRAFQDLNGDSVFGPEDRALPEVTFTSNGNDAITDERGYARLDHLGNGSPTSLHVKAESLPDISLAPVDDGIEIVPRSGIIHSHDFAIVALSEIEGTAKFISSTGSRGVSGVRLQLIDKDNEVASYARTELDGYFFFERVKPGNYKVVVDESQAKRLSLCLVGGGNINVGFESDVYKQDLSITSCNDPLPQPAFGRTALITSTPKSLAAETALGR